MDFIAHKFKKLCTMRDISFYKLRKRQSNRIKDKGQEQAVHKRGNANQQ